MSDTTASSSKRILLYGANGYTGHLIARLAREAGPADDLVLAGRNAAKVEQLGRELGYETRVFGLDVPSTIDACLAGIGVVLHCAGPFSRTSRPMVDACLRMGVHYLDITGELAVFEALLARDAEARQAGVMLMPGAGFDVVPSDCLALHVARRLAHPTSLRIGLLGVGSRLSHGTATTAVENLHKGTCVRRAGALVRVPTGTARKIDFGRGPRLAMAVPLGDLVTAWRSTGIADIETCLGASRGIVIGARVMGFMPWLVGSGPVQKLMKRKIDAAPAGPSDAERAAGRSIVWAEVRDAAGQRAAARLETPDGYTVTAHASLAIARRALAGQATPGYRAPAQELGPDFVLGLPGSYVRTDVA
ncbi:MAG: saccharopine dehydrogenase NADP-binding domain-containing protein [Deltaproteobacteria bacterium]|nr:saccharopine dehydrogenase NADP-binding domain-containing protein [Deltaproteobacteria bacterium]